MLLYMRIKIELVRNARLLPRKDDDMEVDSIEIKLAFSTKGIKLTVEQIKGMQKCIENVAQMVKSFNEALEQIERLFPKNNAEIQKDIKQLLERVNKRPFNTPKMYFIHKLQENKMGKADSMKSFVFDKRKRCNIRNCC